MLIGQTVRPGDAAFLGEIAGDAIEILHLPLDGCVQIGDSDAGQSLQQGQRWSRPPRLPIADGPQVVVMVINLHAGGIDRIDEIADQVLLPGLLGLTGQSLLVQPAEVAAAAACKAGLAFCELRISSY